MQRPITRGASANAGLIFHVFAQDSTSSTGAGKASIAFGSWTCYYIRSGEAISGAITPQDITTIGTYAAPTANTNIRIKAVDNTNMIGVYEIQIHLDWVNTTNSCQSLTIYLTASGVAVLPIQIPLRADDVQTAKPTNFASLSIDGSGRVDVAKIAGTSQTARDIGASVLLSTGTGTGQLDFTSGVVKANATQFAGQTISAAAGVTMPATVASTTNITAGTITTVTNLTNAPTNGDLTATMKASVTTAATAATPTAAAVTAAVSITGDLSATMKASVTTAATAATPTAAAVTGAVGSVTAPVSVTGDFSATMKTSLNAATPAVTVSDKTGFALTAAYDPAKTASQAGDIMKVSSGTGANQISLSSGTVTVGTNNDKTGYTASTVSDKTGYGLTAAYDAAKTAAQASDIPTANITAIKAKTDNLPTDPADASDIAASFSTVNSTLSTIAGYIDTEVAAIKAKTDNLPASPAATGDAMTLTAAYDAAKTAAQASDIPTPLTGDELWNTLTAGASNGGYGMYLLSLAQPGDAMTLTGDYDAAKTAAQAGDIPTADENADALLDRSNGVEVGLTPRNSLRLISAASAGKLSGAATTSVTIRNAVADSKDRIVATVTADGSRTSVTTDLS